MKSLYNLQEIPVPPDWIPERRLWLEVLYVSYHDVLHFLEDKVPVRSKYKLARRSQLWINSPKTDKHSFIWCCESTFDMDFVPTAIKYFRKRTNYPLKDIWDYHHPKVNGHSARLEASLSNLPHSGVEFDELSQNVSSQDPTESHNSSTHCILDLQSSFSLYSKMPSMDLFEAVICPKRYRNIYKGAGKRDKKKEEV